MKFVFLQLLLLPFYGSEAQIVIENGSDGFSLTFNGILLLQHSAQRPLFSVGIGHFDAVYIQGNYNISDDVNELYPLVNWNIVYGPDVHHIHLTSDEDPTIGIKLDISQDDAQTMIIDPDYTFYANVGINRWFMEMITTDDEMIFGGGEQYTYLNLRGRDYPMWVREQGFGRNKSSALTQLVDATEFAGGDYHTTYWPQPSFLSSRRYYFELNLPTYSELRLAPESQSVIGNIIYWHRTPVAGQKCPSCAMRIVTGNSLMEIVQTINPGAPRLPDWVYNGAILGVQGGTDLMLDYLAQGQAAGAMISAMWIQDWSGKIQTNFGTRVFWNWRWNSTWYPNLDTVIQDLKAQNVRVLAYITAHLNVEGDVFQGLSDHDMWLSTKDSEMLLQDFGEFMVSTADIIEPDTTCSGNCINNGRIEYKNLMKQNLLDFGISGWMADFGEYTPMEARTKWAAPWWGQVDQEELLHQTISMDWASLNRELLEENGKLDDTLIWMRSGGIRSKYYQTMSWAGDQAVDWTQSDGLKSSIVAALSLATGGMGLSHSDIGGYTGDLRLLTIRSKELLLRWAEYSAFTPIMRTHEGNHPKQNHQVYSDPDTWAQFARLTQIYVSMKDYILEAVRQNTVDRIPVMSPLFLHFENDLGSFSQDYEYMFGSDVLVAPVTDPEMVEWDVYLPGPQGWIWLWDDFEVPYQGPATVTVAAPLGMPPVFYKIDSGWKDLFRNIRDLYSLTK